MTSRKTAADDYGWKRGAGAYSKEVPLKRGSFPNSVPGTDPRGHGKYTNDDSGLNRVTHEDRKFAAPERRTNEEAKDIYDDVVRNSLDDDAGGSRPGPIRYGVD